MKTFKDTKNRTWEIVINYGSIKRIKDLLDDETNLDVSLLNKYAEDIILLIDTLYCVCKPQADALGISDVEFGESFSGEEAGKALNALVEETINFFPRTEKNTVDENLHKSRVYYFYFQLYAPEKMKIQLLFGADAPFALYCDKKEILRSYAVNPLEIDQFSGQLDIEPGKHDFICAFSSNSGKGWGIACRFKRLDGKKLPRLVELDDLQ